MRWSVGKCESAAARADGAAASRTQQEAVVQRHLDISHPRVLPLNPLFAVSCTVWDMSYGGSLGDQTLQETCAVFQSCVRGACSLLGCCRRKWLK